MKTKEAIELLTMISCFDPMQPLPEEADVLNMKAEMWGKMLHDIPAKVALNITAEWYAVTRQSITVSDIRKRAAEYLCGELPSAETAVENILRVIRRYGNTPPYISTGKSGQEMAFDELTENEIKTINAVGGYAYLCEAELDTYLLHQLKEAYNTYAQREQRDRQLPDAIKGASDKIKKLLGAKGFKGLLKSMDTEGDEGNGERQHGEQD